VKFLSDSKSLIGSGISITTGFDVGAQLPLDLRTVVNNLEELEAIPSSVIYEGLLVYVISESKLYQWKKNLLDDGTLSDTCAWGHIEAEVSAKDIKETDVIDYKDTPDLLMQKNKKDFFPITNQRFVYDDDGVSLKDTIIEINSKLDESIADFEKDAEDTKDQFIQEIIIMKENNQEEMDQMKADLQLEIDNVIEELNKKSEDIEKDINRMLQDMDNSIMSDLQVSDFIKQINENLKLLGEDIEKIYATFNAYKSTVTPTSPVTEVSLSGLGATVSIDDLLMVHMNTVYLTEGIDYTLDIANQKIKRISGSWAANSQFSFDLIKNVDSSQTKFTVYKTTKYSNSAIRDIDLSSFNVPINSRDRLFVYVNSVYLIEDVDYILLSSQSIRCMSGSWNKENLPGYEFSFILVKDMNTSRYNTSIAADASEVSFNDLCESINSQDKLFVHMNSVYLTEGVDYTIDYTNKKIKCKTGTWPIYSEFSFDLIKNSTK
jgi:hypothetical protein